jgi:hypothetical protein
VKTGAKALDSDSHHLHSCSACSMGLPFVRPNVARIPLTRMRSQADPLET